MIPDIPNRYYYLIVAVLTFIGILSLCSMIIESGQRDRERDYRTQVEMVKKNYCLTTIVGSNTMQYQPCGCFVRVER